MRKNQFMAVLAVERCRLRLSHLCAVTHVVGQGGDKLQEKTMMLLLRALEGDLALIEESLGQDIEHSKAA